MTVTAVDSQKLSEVAGRAFCLVSDNGVDRTLITLLPVSYEEHRKVNVKAVINAIVLLEKAGSQSSVNQT